MFYSAATTVSCTHANYLNNFNFLHCYKLTSDPLKHIQVVNQVSEIANVVMNMNEFYCLCIACILLSTTVLHVNERGFRFGVQHCLNNHNADTILASHKAVLIPEAKKHTMYSGSRQCVGGQSGKSSCPPCCHVNFDYLSAVMFHVHPLSWQRRSLCQRS